MDITARYSPWIVSFDIMHIIDRYHARILSIDIIHGYYPWILSIDLICGYDPWESMGGALGSQGGDHRCPIGTATSSATSATTSATRFGLRKTNQHPKQQHLALSSSTNATRSGSGKNPASQTHVSNPVQDPTDKLLREHL